MLKILLEINEVKYLSGGRYFLKRILMLGEAIRKF